jgi:hypothetical protein
LKKEKNNFCQSNWENNLECNKLNVLFLGSYGDYLKELKENLNKNGINVEFLDINDFFLIDDKNIKKYLFLNMPIIFKIFSKLRIFWIFRFFILKYIFKNIDKKYDVVNIHYVYDYYVYHLKDIKKIGSKVIATIWGSDFYRMSRICKIKQRKIYEVVDKISLMNPETKKDFINFYKDFENKCFVARLGRNTLNVIKNEITKKSKCDIKKHIGLPQNKIIVTCGYNAIVQQQHMCAIKALESIDRNILNKIFLVFPMTYGYKKFNYVRNIENMIKNLKIEYKIYSNFMSIEDVSKIRLASDIFINIQTTDQFSMSFQEYLYAKNLVIAGDWLPYGCLTDENVFFLNTNLDKLSDNIEKAITNLDSFQKYLINNPEIIYKFGSWEYNIDSWIKIYSN